MSNLVNDFLINPVLRQARRFSRSNTLSLEVRVPTPPDSDGDHENAVDDIAERVDSTGGGGFGARESSGESRTISDAPLTSSPVEEDGSLVAELEAMDVDNTRHPTVVARHAASYPVPLRVGSLRSNYGQVDHDISDNPDFGIPNRFRNNSTTSTRSHGGYNVANGGMTPVDGPSRRATLEGVAESAPDDSRSGPLPEDDGMGYLRQQIRYIQSMDAPSEEKARLMHQLLTRNYTQAHELSNAQNQPLSPAPTTMISQERPATPSSLSSFLWQMNGSPDSTTAEEKHTFRLSPDDLKRTYAPPDPPEMDEDGNVAMTKDDDPILGCRHYKRNVKLQCSTCNKWYTCRLCHDAVEDHVLIRKETKNMLCMVCGCAQRAGEFCSECGERASWYYCDVCKLWDNDSNKSIYHCNDCGICRKGRGLGKDFFHCKTCGTCMSMAVEHSHKCIERVSDCDCPICGEYMFTSPSPVVFMLCGHGIHKACYDEHMKSSYKCPICSKSTVNMETQFRNLDRAIDSQPMPPQFQDTKAMVSCNDCYAKSAVKYHWLGLKCAICDSYNTAQLSILSDSDGEVSTTEIREPDHATPPDTAAGEGSSASLTVPSLTIHRRHSTHFHDTNLSAPTRRFSPYPRPQRIGRSVSPIAGLGYFDSPPAIPNVETDDSAEDEDLEFWGRDERRSVTSAEQVDDEMEEDDSDCDDEDSTMEDDEDDGSDAFALFGHR